ncbi:MAG: VWA domain-containing protein [Planctomycetes bacterium]|nr:VWA domain-containing protein [Planctomycetota bacterium]
MSGSFRPYIEGKIPDLIAIIRNDQSYSPAMVAFSSGFVLFSRDELENYDNYQKILKLDTEATNLSSALNACSSVKTDKLELILISDGNFLVESDSILNQIKHSDATVYTYLITDEKIHDLKVSDYTASVTGEKIKLTLQLWSDADTETIISCINDEMKQSIFQMQIKKGISYEVIELPLSKKYTITVEPLKFSDKFPHNNRFVYLYTGVINKPKILFLTKDAGSIKFLNSLYPDIVSSEEIRLSKAYDLVIMNNFSLKDISPDKIRSLMENIYESGTALVLFGGPEAYYDGGYLDSDFERVLPCKSAPEHDKDYVFLIDKSGSMKVSRQGTVKKETALSIVAKLKGFSTDSSKATVILFDDKPHLIEKEATFKRLDMNRLDFEPRGATDLQAAVEMLLKLYSTSELALKEVVLITDLETSENVDEMCGALQKIPADITLFNLGEKESAYEKIKSLRNITINENKKVVDASPLIIENGHKVEHYSAELVRSAAVPDLKFINRVSLKESGTLLSKLGTVPLIIQGYYGSGIVIACAFSVLKDWSVFDGSLERLVRSLVEMSLSRSKEQVEVDYEIDSRNGMKLTAWFSSAIPEEISELKAYCPELEKELLFSRVGFNSFTARLPFIADKNLHFNFGSASGLMKLLYPPESNVVSINRKVLQNIASSTGGSVLNRAELLRHISKSSVSFVSSKFTCLLLAAFFFIISVLIGYLYGL